MTEKPITIQDEILKPFWEEEELKEYEEAKNKIEELGQINFNDIDQAIDLIRKEDISIKADQIFKDNDSPFEANELITNDAILEAYAKGLIEEKDLITFAKHTLSTLIDHEILNYNLLKGVVIGRYSNSFLDNPEGILTDIQKILDATDKEEYLQDIANYQRLADLEEKKENNNFYHMVKRLSIEGYTTCFLFFQRQVMTQLAIVEHYKDKGLDENKAFELISKKVEAWYTRPKEYTPGRVVVDYEHELKDLETQPKAGDIRVIDIDIPDTLEYPLDIINHDVWSWLTPKRNTKGELNGQLQLMFNTSKGKKDKKHPVLFSINFDALENMEGLKPIKTLTPFDKSVYNAIANLYVAGNEIVTLRAIHEILGNKGNPNGRQRRKYIESLKKMMILPITLDNTLEREIMPNYPPVKYHGTLLPVEFLEVGEGEGEIIEINGKRVTDQIHIFRLPPLMAFAKKREQITTVPKILLEVKGLSRTISNIAIEHYLLERVARIKNIADNVSKSKRKKGWNKILLATVYEGCQIKPRNTSTARKTVLTLLEHYKENGWIEDYSETKYEIEITIYPAGK